ncbi:MAG: tRNA (guanosine(46)-N7)-methyltransferase TrmB [Planctomycetota bacterium]
MGRRAVPKSARTTDLTGYLWSVDELPAPWAEDQLFARAAPLEIEVGSGKGLFLMNAATALPTHNFLGVEIAKNYAALTASRLARRSIPNAAMLHGDAQKLLGQLVPDNHLQAVHVYFPDPWWKQRHRRRRVMNERFVQDIQRTLRPGGRLHFWTDVEEYFQATREMIAEATELDGPFEVPPQPALHDMDYHTHFERRVRMNGLPVYRAEFAKRGWSVEYTVDCSRDTPE